MKAIFLIAALTPLTLWAQFNFEPDSTSNTRNIYLGTPDSDSIKFEFRLWNNSTHFALFTQLTLNQNDKWNYRTGIEKHNAEIQFFPKPENIDIDELWNTLDSLGARGLPNQNEVKASISKNGKIYKLTSEEFEKVIGFNGSSFAIELFYGDDYRTYHYMNPVQLSDRFQNSKENWLADEHHAMANIVRTIDETFGLLNSFQEYLKESTEKRR